MIDPSAPQPVPEDESPWIEDAEEELATAAPTVAPVVPVSVRPITRSIGPRPRAAPGPRDEGSGWAVAGFLLGGLTLLVIVFGGGYWGLSTLHKSQEAAKERELIQRTNYWYTTLPYAESLKLLNDLQPLETDEQRSQDLIAGFAAGELGTDEATAKEMKSLLEQLVVATGDDPLSGHLSRPHLLRRILPMVPKQFRANFAVMDELISSIGIEDPQVTLVRVRPWDTGDSKEDGRVVYTHIQSGPYGEIYPIRVWVVRDQGAWKCVDYEFINHGLSEGEEATLLICCLICEDHPLHAIINRSEVWDSSPTLKQPEVELAWLTAEIQQLPKAIRDSRLIYDLRHLNRQGMSAEMFASAIANLPESTRATLRGQIVSQQHLIAGRAEKCLQECDAFRSRFGDTSPSILKDRVHALLALGRFDDALHDLEAFAPRFPTESTLYSSFALACRPDDVKPLVAAVMRHPRPGVAISQAYYALTRTRGTESLNQFIESLSRDPRCGADVARLRSWQAANANNPEGALAAMRQALELASGDRRDEFLGATFQHLLTHGQAAEACALYPDDAKLVATLVQTFYEEDSWPYEKDGCRPLLAPLKRLTAARPQDYEAWHLLGTVHSTLEEWDDAVVAFAHSLQVEPVETPSSGDQTPGDLERAKLAYFSWLSAMQSAGRWTELEEVIAKDPQAIERLVLTLSWSSEPGTITWAKQFLAEHPESPHVLALQTALAQQAEDWASARQHLATRIDQEKDETKLDALRRQLAIACINDRDLEQSWKQIVTAKNLNFACQALQQRGETGTLLRLVAILKAEQPSSGIRSRLPYWEAQAWAQIGRYRELDSAPLQKLFVNPPAEDLAAIQTLAHQWDGHTTFDSERKGIRNEILTPDDLQYKRIQLAIAARLGNIDQLRGLLSDEQQQERFQYLYSQPAYHSLWTEAYRPIREIAPLQWKQSFFQSRLILLEPGEAPDPTQWESRLNGLPGVLGTEVEIVPLTVAPGSPARQIYCVRSREQECLVAMGSEPADISELQDSYSQLTTEHRDLLRTHRWWIQVSPAPSTSYGETLWSETVAAAIVSEQTIAVYHDALRRADIGTGPMEFRLAALEVHRFAHSVQPWSGLDVQKLRRSGDCTGTFWWTGPQRKEPVPESSTTEPKSLFEQFRSCPPDQVVRATVRSLGEWYSEPLVVDVERLVIQQGELQSVRCRVVTPSRLSPRLVTGEPVLLSLYQLHEPQTVPRASESR